MTGRASTQIIVWLGTISHADLVPLHGVIDGIDSGGTLRVVHWRRDFVSRGEAYRAAAFRFRPPEQGGEFNTIPVTIDNVDDEITSALQAIATPAVVTFERVHAHAPDTVTMAYRGLRLLGSSWNRQTINAGVGRRRTSGPLMGLTVNPADNPAAFS